MFKNPPHALFQFGQFGQNRLTRGMDATDVQAYRAVLFDFDGVIADTMGANFRAWRSAFFKLGVEIASEAYYPLEGMSPVEVARTLGRLYGLDEPMAAKVAVLKEQEFLAGKKCDIFPTVKPLLVRLRAADKVLGLVTGASKLRLEATLSDDIRVFFDVIIAADAVSRCKPAPDPFLRAAEEIGVDPLMCVVVENAPLGIAAARRAGMKCIAVCSTLGADFLQEADIVVNDLEEVGGVLFGN